MQINYPALAEGFYNLIPDNEKSCMIYGMMPKKFMDLFEKNIRERLVLLSYPDASEKEVQVLALIIKPEIISEIMHRVTVELLRIATEKGLCIA